MQLPLEVKHLNVLKRRYLGLVPRLEAFIVHPLILETAKPAFSRRISQQSPFRLVEQTIPYSFSLS